MNDEQQLLLLLLLLAVESSTVSAQGTIQIGATQCYACGLGTYSAQDGTAQCSFCAAGQYADTNSSTGCKYCPAGNLMYLCMCNGSLTMCALARCAALHACGKHGRAQGRSMERAGHCVQSVFAVTNTVAHEAGTWNSQVIVCKACLQ